MDHNKRTCPQRQTQPIPTDGGSGGTSRFTPILTREENGKVESGHEVGGRNEGEGKGENDDEDRNDAVMIEDQDPRSGDDLAK